MKICPNYDIFKDKCFHSPILNSIYDIKKDERNYESASRNMDIKMIWLVKSSAFSFDR